MPAPLQLPYGLPGLQPGMVLVTDSWASTVTAINQFKRDNGWGGTELRHVTVNHAQGEIVRCEGYSTNQVENKWSVVKQWMRKRCGGRLPAIKDRATWTQLIEEFQYRKYALARAGTGTKNAPRTVQYFFNMVAETST